MPTHILLPTTFHSQQRLGNRYVEKLIESGKEYDEIVAIGPLIMMKFVVQIAKEHRIKCTVSLNSIMVDAPECVELAA